MSVSSAVSQNRISRIVGYQLTKGFFQETTPNLPQSIAILAEANTANQAGLTSAGVEVSSAQQAGELWGFGSPIYQIMRILRPLRSDGVGAIPTIVYPQVSDGAAVAAARAVTVTGVATKAGVHTVIINGRDNIDGDAFDIAIASGDDQDAIAQKISDVVNGVLASPVSGGAAGAVATLTTKWEGATSEELTVEIDMNDQDLGVSYAVASSAVGSGAVDITDGLADFGNRWNTIVVNSYGSAQHTALQTFNGIPKTVDPTGRYTAITFKPFLALWGSKLDTVAAITAITDTSTIKLEVTNALCPAPNSPGFSYEAAANGAVLFATTAESTPHLDVNNRSYPDMPVPSDRNIGDFSDYQNRDTLVKSGSSTIDLINDLYTFMDFVTTYHPDGENPPQYRYCRNLMLDFNVRYTYFLQEQINVVDKAIIEDSQPTNVANTVKPKQWKGVLSKMFEDLAERALIAEPDFSQANLQVAVGTTNPDRFETAFKYKRTGTARISSTTAEAGFNFGN